MVGRDLIRYQVRLTCRGAAGGALWGTVLALDQDMARYSIITRPIRLLVGSRTAPRQAEAVNALATVIPNAAITVLDNQGHGALLQAPGLVASAISDFIFSRTDQALRAG